PITRQAPARIAHTHLKDVDVALAKRVQTGELTYTEAVRIGMYKPLGQGDVDIAGVIGHLEAHDYDGWYVLEQDTILTEEPMGEGPVADVQVSADYIRPALTARACQPGRPGGGRFMTEPLRIGILGAARISGERVRSHLA